MGADIAYTNTLGVSTQLVPVAQTLTPQSGNGTADAIRRVLHAESIDHSGRGSVDYGCSTRKDGARQGVPITVEAATLRSRP